MLETSLDGHDGPLNKNYPACRIQGAQLRNASLDVSLLEVSHHEAIRSETPELREDVPIFGELELGLSEKRQKQN